jgi:precorrin-3B methylase
VSAPRCSDLQFPACSSDSEAGALELQSKPYCDTRNKLAEALVDLSIKLAIAASQMADVAGGDHSTFANAKTAMEQLRDECDNLRLEVTRHRAQHGC